LDQDVVEKTIEMDPLTSYLKPSMQQDLEKVSHVSHLLVIIMGLK
jgi:ketopantoate reductase